MELTIVVLVLTGAVCLIVFETLRRAGLCKRVELRESYFQSQKVAVKTVIGAYKDVGIHFQSLSKLLADHIKDDNAKLIGIYHDVSKQNN